MINKPNILVIMTDHTNAASLRPDSQCLTPNLSALSNDGVQFENCYTTNAICSPARASLMTGLYPSSHGVWDVTHAHTSDWIDAPAGRFIHFAELLSDHGYRNGYFGKWHVEQSNRLENFGWHEFDVTGNSLMIDRRRIGDNDYHSSLELNDEVIVTTDGYPDYLLSATVTGTDKITHPAFDQGIDFIERHLENNGFDIPFTCFISVLEPHDPYLAPKEIMDLYDPTQISLSPSFDDDLETKPEVLKRMRSVWSGMDKSDWQKVVTSYYASITSVDTEIERVINLLKEKDLYENTVIVFTSDHGDMLGAHGLLTKGVGTGYEEVYNIPLIVKTPNGCQLDSTAEIKVSTVDIAPTLLDYAGVEIPSGIHGKSLIPIISNTHNKKDWTGSYAEFFSQRFMYTQRITWEGRWKYIFNPAGRDELYDLQDDPNEMNNLAECPDFKEVLNDMAREMWRNMERIGDSTLLESGYATLRTAPIGPLSRFD